jgi:hypothetical protein
MTKIVKDNNYLYIYVGKISKSFNAKRMKKNIYNYIENSMELFFFKYREMSETR